MERLYRSILGIQGAGTTAMQHARLHDLHRADAGDDGPLGKMPVADNLTTALRVRHVVRRTAAFKSKSASDELGRRIEQLTAHHKATGGQYDPTLAEWVATLPANVRDRVVQIGVLDRRRVALAKPLSDHIDDFQESLRAKGSTDKHVALVVGRVRRLAEACGFRNYTDISADRAVRELERWRMDTDKESGIGAQTSNLYVQTIKRFCRWMIREGRATESPVDHLSKLNVSIDRRHERRALSTSELTRLLRSTHAEPDRFGMTGPERTLLYRLAVESGLRASELRSLTRAAFDLAGDSPSVTVSAAYSKRRREDRQPLRPDTAVALLEYLRTKTPAARAFNVPPSYDTADMLRADLAAANIAYRDESGRVADFHALRHTFITNLAAGGVHPKTAQELARHSTITLTMDRYTHVCRNDKAAALDALPDLDNATQQVACATGTDGRVEDPKNSASCLAPKGRRVSLRGGAG